MKADCVCFLEGAERQTKVMWSRRRFSSQTKVCDEGIIG